MFLGVADEEHDVVWFQLKKDAGHECSVCGQVFQVKFVHMGYSVAGDVGRSAHMGQLTAQWQRTWLIQRGAHTVPHGQLNALASVKSFLVIRHLSAIVYSV